MSLPKDFEPIIKEEYGNFGWQLANCFSYIAEYLGHKVLDISSVETALKIIANECGNSLTKYGHPTNLTAYLETSYRKVNTVFIRRAKDISLSDEDSEEERKEKVIERFLIYIMGTEMTLMMVKDFYRDYVKQTLINNLTLCFDKIQNKVINEKMEDIEETE